MPEPVRPRKGTPPLPLQLDRTSRIVPGARRRRAERGLARAAAGFLGWGLALLLAGVAPAQPAEGEAEPEPAPAPTATPAPPEIRIGPDEAPEVLYEAGSTPGAPVNVLESGGVALDEGEAIAVTAPASPRTTLVVRDKPINDVFNEIREKTGVRIEARGQAQGQTLSLAVRDTPVEQILESIAQERGWRWVKFPDGSYQIMDQQTYVQEVQAGQVIRRVFDLKYINARELATVLEPMINREIGSIAADERSNKLIVAEMPDRMTFIESIINEYDTQLFTRVFEIRNASTEEVADRLAEIKSTSAIIHVDPVNHLIIVEDTFEKIKIMEQLVELLDRDQEIFIYNLTNIGLDGEIADEIVSDFIEPIVSEDALLRFQVSTGRLILKDVKAVHDKVYDILLQLDRPRKQVLIEGEVLSVGMSNDLRYGLEWEYSPELIRVLGVDEDDEVNLDEETFPRVSSGSSGLSVLELTDHVRAQLNAALTDSRSKILLRPRLIIANHELGTFEVTRNEPVLQTFFSNNINSDFRTRSQTTIPSGLIVDITPHISNRGLVELEINFENSTPIIVEDLGDGTRGVGTAEESTETILIIPDGETRVIGGLISRDRNEGSSGIPVLSQIPYLGALFGNKTKRDTLRNLMFFITPHIIEERPKNDLIVEPVNELARQAMAESMVQAVAPPEDLNEVPPEIQEYLRQIRPTAIPLEDAPTTMPIETQPIAIPDFETGGEELGAALLRDEPYVDPDAVETGLVVGGAGPQAPPAARGPAGSFGGTERGVVSGAAAGRSRAEAAGPAGPTDAVAVGDQARRERRQADRPGRRDRERRRAGTPGGPPLDGRNEASPTQPGTETRF